MHENWEQVSSKLDSFDNLVACSTSNKGFVALPLEVQTCFTQRDDVIWVDGNDVDADHSVLECASMVFRREMN
jgi:hypothetical protein